MLARLITTVGDQYPLTSFRLVFLFFLLVNILHLIILDDIYVQVNTILKLSFTMFKTFFRCNSKIDDLES